MTRKWGSCCTPGIVTLAADLADQQPGFQDFVIAHELLHLRVPNHGRLFKALLTAHVPAWKSHDLQRRRGISIVPDQSRISSESQVSHDSEVAMIRATTACAHDIDDRRRPLPRWTARTFSPHSPLCRRTSKP